jgi:oligopeptide/dipeptide ABC transporter ATP-binding protein
MNTEAGALLEIQDLEVVFHLEEGPLKAVDGAMLTVKTERVLGLVGESGCGKSVTAKSILRLVPQPPGEIVAGKAIFQGQDLLKIPRDRLRKEYRGKQISMIFQDPMTSLNPVFSVGDQLAEVFTTHRGMGKKEALEASAEILERVGIPSAHRRIRDYPHQFSGGMRQRVMIAMALACAPKFLIADEPTTALDVTIQAQILELMKELQREMRSAILLITHNLGVVAEMAHEVAVMYAGQIVESCPVEEFFDNPRHPYSIGLLRSFPGMVPKGERILSIPGSIPDMLNPPPGCRFHPRCQEAMPRCRRESPPDRMAGDNHHVRCWLHV